jgi:TPR repeat protein
MLVSARGVPRDFVDGLAWLILAARHGVAPEGEQRVRAHLAGRPQDIAAAERRAQELRQQIEARRGTKPPWPPPDIAPGPQPPAISMPPVDKPKFTRPTMEPPKITPAPPFALPPPVPPTTGTSAPPGG